MRNTLGDLNNHLFAQLERLNDEDLSGEELAQEINRANSINSVAKQIISNGHLVLKAIQVSDDRNNADTKVPKMLEGNQ